MNKEEEKYKLTEWGCLLVTLQDYNIDVSHITPVMGKHMVEDFLKTMEIAGYIAKTDESQGVKT